MTAGRRNVTDCKEWGTPKHYVKAVRQVFGGNISLDPCSNQYSIVGADTEYMLPGTDGLVATWNYSSIFCNPPYGVDKDRGTRISDWIKRCKHSNIDHGSEVIALIPVATNTRHWKDYIWNYAKAVCFLYDTRLKFLINGESVGKGAPMACCMVYWGPDFRQFRHVFSVYGAVVRIG